jgi:IclR family pca regulon transcriptional regulator
LKASHDSKPAKDARRSQSLERGIAILESFTPKKELRGNKEVADELGMTPPTTHRYISTLKELGWVTQPQGSEHKYWLGLRATDIGMRALKGRTLYIRARPCLEELRRAVSYTVYYAVRDNEEIVLLDRLQGFRGHARLGLNLGPGSRLPIYCTSLGKILLADLPTEQRKAIVNGLAPQDWGPNTIIDKDLLISELELIRTAGFAISDEELRAEVQSVAVPVRDDTGEVVAAVSVSAPKSMIGRSQMTKDFVPRLLTTAEHISANLKGWTDKW